MRAGRLHHSSSPSAAGRRPFLDAGEIVVGAVAVRPHRQDQRAIGLVLVLEARGSSSSSLARACIGGLVRRCAVSSFLIFRSSVRMLARRLVAAEPAHRSSSQTERAGRNTVKAALAQDRRLQRELRRQGPCAPAFRSAAGRSCSREWRSRRRVRRSMRSARARQHEAARCRAESRSRRGSRPAIAPIWRARRELPFREPARRCAAKRGHQNARASG